MRRAQGSAGAAASVTVWLTSAAVSVPLLNRCAADAVDLAPMLSDMFDKLAKYANAEIAGQNKEEQRTRGNGTTRRCRSLTDNEFLAAAWLSVSARLSASGEEYELLQKLNLHAANKVSKGSGAKEDAWAATTAAGQRAVLGRQ